MEGAAQSGHYCPNSYVGLVLQSNNIELIEA